MPRQSRLTIQNCILKGYFPAELPPPFSTKSLSDEISNIINSTSGITLNINGQKIYSSQCSVYSIPKILHQRRILGIPNPYHQLKVFETIISNWSEIKKIINKSKYSLTKPIIRNDMPRAINREHNFNEIPSIFPIMSTSSRYVLKTDISRFYPTIYTHSIPWVCHGKQYSKTHKKASIYGNELDTNVRNTQDQQTFGIPIGPDSSYVIAELIGSRIDQEIYNELHLDGIRYLDDYYFFTNSLSEAEEALTRIQRISKFYELEINPEKTKIYELPESLEYNWTSEIRNFKFHGSVKRQKTDLITFFSKAYEYCKKYPDEYVLKYSLARIKNELISRENWELYESLILNSMIAEPSVIPTVLEIFLAYLNAGYNLNLKKIEKTINNLICYHSKLGHGFEVSWCLWLAKSLSIKISRSAAKEISQMDDTIAVLTALDLRNDGLVQSGLDLSAWNNICTHENLYQEKWIFAYEAIKKGWLSSRTNYIGNDAFFSQLELRNVEFYDASLQVIPAVLNSSTQNNRNTYSFGSGGAGGY